MKYGYGVDVGGTTVKIGFFSENGTMIRKWELPTDLSDQGNEILGQIAASVRQDLFRNPVNDGDLLGIGLGVPGSVLRSGRVNRSANLGWTHRNLTEEFSAMTGLPVRVANDANAAALGECWLGAGQNTRNMVMVTLGTGVGGGIITDGSLLYGAHGVGAEIGHMVLNRNETERCTCGKFGCVEQYCSATGIVRMARIMLAESPQDSPLRHLEPLSCQAIFNWGQKGDPLAVEILNGFYRYMGEFLASVSALCDPEVIVLGGGVSKAGPMLLRGIRPWFDFYMFHSDNPISIVLATLGNDAGICGAFRLLLDPIPHR